MRARLYFPKLISAPLGWFIFLILYFLVNLGGYPLIDPDEGRYGEVAREMAVNHDWIIPHLNGVPFFHKPILFYWLTALNIHLWGANAFAVRLLPACCGFLSSLMVYYTGKYLFDRRAGIFAALILATMPLYFGAAHYVNMDLLIATLITATLCSFILSLELPLTDPRRTISAFAYWVFAALGILAKGLIGFVLPGLVILVWLILSREWRILRNVRWFSGSILFLAIALPWFLLAEQRAPGFLHYFFITQQVTRYLGHQFNNIHAWWFYIPVVLMGILPWTIAILIALWEFTKQWWSHPKQNNKILFLILWPWVIGFFFSIPQSKIVGYSLPILPPLALLTGAYFSRYWPAAASPPVLIKGLVSLASLAIIGIPILFFYLRTPKLLTQILPAQAAIYTLLALIFLACILMLWMRQRLRRVFWLTFYLSIIGLMLTVLKIVALIPTDTQIIANRIMTIQTENAQPIPVICYENYFFSLPFYLQQTVSVVTSWDDPNLLQQDNWQEQLGTGLTFNNADKQLYLTPSVFAKQWPKQLTSVLVVSSLNQQTILNNLQGHILYQYGSLILWQ